MVYPTSHRRINSLRSSIGYLIGGVGAVLMSEGITMVFQYTGLKRPLIESASTTSSVCWDCFLGLVTTSNTVKDITASTKIRKVGPKASKSFNRMIRVVCNMLIGGKFQGQFYGSKSRLKIDHQKVHLEQVELEDQKARLRAVWMGRNLGVKIESFLGSKIRGEKEAIFEVDFEVKKRLNFYIFFL